MTIHEQVWQKIELAADNEIAAIKGMNTSEKEISMWLATEGFPPLPAEGDLTENWNRVDFLIGAIALQKNVIRGHRHFMRLESLVKTYPARMLEIGPHDPPWLQERWENALRRVGPQGAKMSPRVALMHHPVWLEISEISRPFEPFFPVSAEYPTFTSPVSGRDLRRREILAITEETRPLCDSSGFQRWNGAGRITLDEWLSIFRARLESRLA